jgi:hypothetical protein
MVSFNSLRVLICSLLCHVFPIQHLAGPVETLAFLLLRSPILGCHVTMWYSWRVLRIHGNVSRAVT